MAVVAFAALVPVTAMMSANLNTAQMVDDRRQVQDAADALSILHGAWSARALNIISMNNVTAAQLLTVAVGSEALFFTNNEILVGAARVTQRLRQHRSSECTYRLPPPLTIGEKAWVGLCRAWNGLLHLPAALATFQAFDINSDFDPVHGILTATKALEAIDGMNRALAARHPRAMAEIAADYRSLLDIKDHHFADPCDGPDLANRCRSTNSNDGMALPVKPAEFAARLRLQTVMKFGTGPTDTTFDARGFRNDGPLEEGGSSARPSVDDHINNITEIGNVLYGFNRFYSSRISHMPMHPVGPLLRPFGIDPPYEAPYQGDPFVDRTRDAWDVMVPIVERVVPISNTVLGVLRNIYPFGFQTHQPYLFQRTQSRTGNNSFYRNYSTAHGTILLGKNRATIPIGVDLKRFQLVNLAPVPETYQLEGIDPGPWNLFPPVEAESMPEAFHILGYALKDRNKRLSETVIPTNIETHTGYGQSGVFNPDGATLFSQNWNAEMMPATRLDDLRAASRDLARQARAGFDDLATQLDGVTNTSDWERVNAH